jgi:cholesterol transport system auxiliary component
MKFTIKQMIALASVALVSGCSFMSPVQTMPETGYLINAVPAVKKSSQRAGAILVLRPETNPIYNSTRMAYTTRPYQITYYGESRWAEAPADMLASLIAQTLQKTNHYKAIITPPFTGLYSYALRTQIKTLLIDYSHPRPVFRLSIQAQLISASSNRLLSSHDFTVTMTLPQRSPYGAVVAANRAAEKIMSEMAVWCVKYTQ